MLKPTKSKPLPWEQAINLSELLPGRSFREQNKKSGKQADGISSFKTPEKPIVLCLLFHDSHKILHKSIGFCFFNSLKGL